MHGRKEREVAKARFREAACGAIGGSSRLIGTRAAPPNAGDAAQGDPSCRPEKIMIESD
jgi:hypothetical protein